MNLTYEVLQLERYTVNYREAWLKSDNFETLGRALLTLTNLKREADILDFNSRSPYDEKFIILTPYAPPKEVAHRIKYFKELFEVDDVIHETVDAYIIGENEEYYTDAGYIIKD